MTKLLRLLAVVAFATATTGIAVAATEFPEWMKSDKPGVKKDVKKKVDRTKNTPKPPIAPANAGSNVRR